MLYYLFNYIDKQFDLPGAGLFQYISFRAGAAALLSLLITITFGKNLINFLRRRQVGDEIRDLGLEGQLQKKGTPTMGGIIIIAGILVPTLLFAKLDNVYVILLIIATLWLGLIGLLDDYIKVFKKNKEGLAGRFKIVGQVGLGLIVGLTLFFNSDVLIRDVTIKDSPMWTIHVADSDGVDIIGVRILNGISYANNDGIHCTSSRNIHISDCHISAGDDGICVTGFGPKKGVAENVTVSNCTIQSRVSSGERVAAGAVLCSPQLQ